MRGELSQIEVSKKLGFNFNQYHKWEVGSKSLTLFEFMDICKVLDFKTERFFNIIVLINIEEIEESEVFSTLYNKLGPKSKDELADLLKINKSTLYRWFKGNGSPDLSLILMWVDSRTQYLSDALAQFIGNNNAFEILNNRDKEQIKKRIGYGENPYMAAVQYFFNTSRYELLENKSISNIAECLGLSEQEVETSIDILLKTKAIHKVRNKYINNDVRTDLGNINMVTSAQMAKYWNNKVIDRFSTSDGVPKNSGKVSNMWAYRIIPVPKELEPKIKEKFSLCINEIINMVNASKEKPDSVKAIIVNYFDIEKP